MPIRTAQNCIVTVQPANTDAIHPAAGLSRRRALALMGGVMPLPLALNLSGCAKTAAQVRDPVDVPAGAANDDRRAYELCDRLTWGATDAEVTRLQRMGLQSWLAQQLHPAAGDALPSEVNAQIEAFASLRRPLPELTQEFEQRRKDVESRQDPEEKKTAQQAYQGELNRHARDTAARHVLRALYSPYQVREQMVWFWMNHFSVFQGKANLRLWIASYEEDAVRPHALGRFRDLLRAVTLHPAMLRYLDNEQNAAGRINENLAREVMELHTLGVDGGYSQRDVQEMARVLTGVGINATGEDRKVRRELQDQYVRSGIMEFHPARHDQDAKTLLGQPLRSRGLAEVHEALDRLAAHPATARRLARKLAVWWIEDEPSEAVVSALADAYTGSQGDIAQVLSTLFNRPEFQAATRRKFKDPMRFALSAVRLAYDERPVLNAGPVLGWLQRMGEPLYGRVTPDGYPMVASAWVSPGQLTTRFEIAKAIGSGSAGLFRTEGMQPADRPAFPQLSNALYYRAIRATLAPATRATLEQAASPQEWNALLLSSPEFMRR